MTAPDNTLSSVFPLYMTHSSNWKNNREVSVISMLNLARSESGHRTCQILNYNLPFGEVPLVTEEPKEAHVKILKVAFVPAEMDHF